MKYKLTIGWLYPELMSTYGDRGNILILKKRCEWRGIDCNILPIDFSTKIDQPASPAVGLLTVNLLFGGGAQDRQQSILISDLRKRVGPVMKEMINKGIPGLFVCGSPQLLGSYYVTAEGQKLEGLGIFDMETTHPGQNSSRCIGNTVVEINLSKKSTVVGFENHGGRTYLGAGVKQFGKVIIGKGNNGEDGSEGALYKNSIATYSHGPLLSKNPHIADWLITKALEVKYHKKIKLRQLDDSLEWKAHDVILRRYNLS
jgi:hypothetical protein